MVFCGEELWRWLFWFSGTATTEIYTCGHTLSLRDARPISSIRILTSRTPAAPTALPFVPRDLYPHGPGGDPLRADGKIEASQRGLNAGLLYFQIARPAFGNIFYPLNLTALGDYFRPTDKIGQASCRESVCQYVYM